VSWDEFREAFEKQFGEQTSENIKRVKKVIFYEFQVEKILVDGS
jgi:hypothetical protein